MANHLTIILSICLYLITNIATLNGQELPVVFNGKDLSGWKVPENNIWFSAEKDVLNVKNGPKQKGATLWTENDYKDFVMHFEFKLGQGTVDTGIFVRNKKEQIQIGESGSLKRDMTGSPYIAGKGYPVEAKGVSDLLKKDDWNKMVIMAVGNNYNVWLNGKHVMTYESETAIESGPIGIQLHPKREMTCFYRNIRLAILP
ncbi:MAG: DUF1080 domain-containing protein [Planctomycetota bacterium]